MKHQRGSVIIIVLWTSILLTVLVTVMAGKVQLSARTAFYNQQAVQDLAAVTAAMNKAEMEILLESMQKPIDQPVLTDIDGNPRESLFRFNGQPLTLNYPADDNIVVRIYNHAGKINLNGIRGVDMRMLIENRLGPDFDPQEVQELMAAWADWTDLDDRGQINGAEKDYYQSLDPPYSPRNNSELDSVEELRLIRGFDELFKGVNLDAAFTVYGTGRSVNLNLATREAMQLLPGLDDELIEKIIFFRQQREIRNKPMVAEIVPLEKYVQLDRWIGDNTSTVYSVYAYPKATPSTEQDSEQRDPNAPEVDPVTQAYMEIMEVRSYQNRGRVYKVDPYSRLPDTTIAQDED